MFPLSFPSDGGEKVSKNNEAHSKICASREDFKDNGTKVTKDSEN